MDSGAQATRALRQVVSVAGVQPEEYALDSLRFEGATHLSARGAAPEVLKREGRWASGAYKGYVRSHEGDAQLVSGVTVEGRVSRNSQDKRLSGVKRHLED